MAMDYLMSLGALLRRQGILTPLSHPEYWPRLRKYTIGGVIPKTSVHQDVTYENIFVFSEKLTDDKLQPSRHYHSSCNINGEGKP